MADYHMLPFSPVYPISKKVNPRHRRAKMPSLGIERSAAIGLNQYEPEWEVRWVLSPEDANALDLFLAERAQDGKYFLWTAPVSLQARYRCKSWTKTISNHNTQEVSATFVRHYSYELPSFSATKASYSISTNIRIIYNRTLSASTLNLYFSGGDVTLTRGRPIYVQSANYLIYGEAALCKQSIMIAANATFPRGIATGWTFPGDNFHDANSA